MSVSRRRPVQVAVSHVLNAILSTTNRLPQNCSISGMKGRESSSPRSSSPARISSAGLTSTTSPMDKVGRTSDRSVVTLMSVLPS